MPTINLMEVLRTGSLGDIGPGVSRSQVERLLGPPDDVEESDIVHLFYGCLNLQLDSDGSVDFASITMGNRFPAITASVAFDPCGIKSRMTSEEFAKAMQQAGLRCRESYGSAPGFLTLVINRQTTAHFEEVDGVLQLLFLAFNHGEEIWEREGE